MKRFLLKFILPVVVVALALSLTPAFSGGGGVSVIVGPAEVEEEFGIGTVGTIGKLSPFMANNGYLESREADGLDFIIKGETATSTRYINLGTTVGTTGFGFRNSTGSMQVKDYSGSWSDIATAGDLTLYVPYTGATGTVDLGTHGILFGDGGTSYPSIAFSGDTDMGFYRDGANLYFVRGGASLWQFSNSTFGKSPSGGYGGGIMAEVVTATNPGIVANTGDGDTGLGWAGGNLLTLVAGGVESARFAAAAITMNAATTINADLTVTGLSYLNLTAGVDNSVVIQDSGGELRTDEADSRIFGTSLVDGSGATNRVAVWSDSNTLIGYSNLHWTPLLNRLGINDTTPSYSLDVSGTLRSTGHAYLNQNTTFGGYALYDNGLDYQFTMGDTKSGPITGVLRARLRAVTKNDESKTEIAAEHYFGEPEEPQYFATSEIRTAFGDPSRASGANQSHTVGRFLASTYSDSLRTFDTVGFLEFKALFDGETDYGGEAKIVLAKAGAVDVEILRLTTSQAEVNGILKINSVIGTSAENTVLVYSGTEVKRDEINAKVWLTSIALIDGTNLSANQITYATDFDSITSEAGFEYNPSTNIFSVDSAVMTDLTTDWIDFNLSPTGTMQEGRMRWNSDDGTAELGMPGGNVNLQFGQELLVRAQNTSGVTIPNGAAVYVSGGTGTVPEIGLANATTHLVANATIAVATEEILNNQFGYVNSFGLVRDMDTSMAVADGGPLFLSTTDGVLTSTLPTQPNSQVFVGVAIRKHATEGILFVKIIPQPNLEELSDVLISSIADNDITYWDNANSVWKNKTIEELGYVPYTGATQNVDLGNYTLSSSGLFLAQDELLTIGTETLTWDATHFVFSDSGQFGGTASGQSIFSSGFVSNEDGGNTAADSFRAETGNVSNALYVNAVTDVVELNSGVKYAYAAKTANYTLTSQDYQINCTANSFTITLPTASGIAGRVYSIKDSGTGTITVDGNGTETIDGNTILYLTTYDNLKIMSDGSNWIII